MKTKRHSVNKGARFVTRRAQFFTFVLYIRNMINDENEQNRRLSICNGCEFKRPESVFLWGLIKFGADQCSLCKCVLKNKVIFTATKCPKGKWKKHDKRTQKKNISKF